MQIQVEVDVGQPYRIFAGQGNWMSDRGVTVVLRAPPLWELEIHFCTRQDAVRFFQHAADAAADASPTETGDGGLLMVEGRTLSREEIEALP